MTSFAWSPGWYHAHESFWSVASKIAYANCAPVGEVLEYLIGATPKRREVLLFPDSHAVLHACQVLGLESRAAARYLFAGLGVPKLVERENWRVGLRYCQRCLDGCFHCTRYQDLREQVCPVHHTPLATGCPYCGRIFDPFCGQVWKCNYCGCPLTEPKIDWLAQFRQEPPINLAPLALADRRPAVAEPLTEAGEGALLLPQLADLVFEELLAVTHVYMGTHHDCLGAEANLESAVLRPVEFRCPVAAAAIVCASRLGVPHPGASGSWLRTRAQISESWALCQLQYLLASLPVDRQPLAVRDAVRGWYVEALDFFVSAAGSGQYDGLWVPSLDASLGRFWGSTDVLWVEELWSKAGGLISKADGLCGLQTPMPMSDLLQIS